MMAYQNQRDGEGEPVVKSSQCCFEQRFPALGKKGFSFYYSLSSLCLTWDARACRKFQLLLEKWDRIPRAGSWRACWDPNRSKHYPICKLNTGKVCKAWERRKQPGTVFWEVKKSERNFPQEQSLIRHILTGSCWNKQNTGRWNKKRLDLDKLWATSSSSTEALMPPQQQLQHCLAMGLWKESWSSILIVSVILSHCQKVADAKKGFKSKYKLSYNVCSF